MATAPASSTNHSHDNDELVLSSSSSSSAGSEWEENIDDRDDDSAPSSAPPPPVIFAGISSPGRFRIPTKRLSNAATSNTRRRTTHHHTLSGTTRVIRRNSLVKNDGAGRSGTPSPQMGPTSVTSSSSMMNNIEPTLMNDSSLTPTPSTMPRRPSISSISIHRPSGLVTASCRADIQRRSRQGARLKNQVTELEAALDHSKAKEGALKQNLDDLREQLLQKNKRLEERQKVIYTLEQEHRRMKKHFRDLMESTLDSSGSGESQRDADSQHGEDTEMSDVREERDQHQHDGEGGLMQSSTMMMTSSSIVSTDRQPIESQSNEIEIDQDTQMANRAEQQQPSSSSSPHLQVSQLSTPFPSSGGSYQVSSSRSTNFRRETNTTTATTRRTRSVPPVPKTTARDQDLRSRLRETEELLETLRGTNGYAQQVLKRNSVLEKRCDELENLRDTQLKEVYDELQRCRVEQIEAATAAERFRNDAADARQQLADLHSELQKLHEKMRRQQDASNELVAAKEALVDARETLASRVAEAQRSAAEWDAERQHLLRNVDLHKRLLAARGEGGQDDSATLRERNTQLEELLGTTREQSSIKIRELGNEVQELKNQVRTLTSKLDHEQRSSEDQNARNAELEESVGNLQQQLETLRAVADRARHDVAKLTGKSAEAEELKNQLKAERDRISSQNAQIARHLETIKESNQRFADLVERNNVLDKLLQKQQKEKENLVADNMKTNSKLYGQADNYRKKWEATSVEVQTLKKQLCDSSEKLRLAVEREKVEKDSELRQLRDEFAAQRLALHRNADSEMTKLRGQHAQEMNDLRKLKDVKLETVVKQYETYLADLKGAHERHVRDLQGGKDKDAARTKEEINQRVSEAQALWKERLNEERSRHEKEIQTLTASYQDNLQNELKKKTEDIEKLRRNLDAQRSEMERISLMAERRIQDERLQREQLSARIATEAQDASTSATVEEKERGRAALLAAQAEHAKAIKTIEDAHAQVAQTLNRKLAITNERLNGTVAENEKLMGAVASREAALGAARAEIAKAAENAEAERKKEAAAALKEQEALKTQLAEARRTLQQLREGMSSTEEIERLNERIETLMMSNTELENRLRNERDLLKSQLNAKEERLQTLLTENSHTRAILKRNSELEEASAKEKKEIEVSLQRQRERVAALEGEINRLQDGLSRIDNERRQLKSEIDGREKTIERLSKRLVGMEERTSRQRELEERIKSLTAEAKSLRRQLESSQEAPDHDSEANSRYRERLRELSQELNDSSAKSRRLEEEIMKMKTSVEESSRLTLELQHMKSRLESQEELLDLVKQRALKKDEIIEDLKVQLNLLSENRRSDPSESDTENEKKLEELAKRCQDLSDLQQTFEQERRSLEHRMELDRQILTQKIDQKERQLDLLMETNKRAELCFARNVELEEMLFKLTNELDTLRRTQENNTSSTSEENTTNSTTIMNSALHTSTVREEKLRQELDGLRSDLMQKDGEIRLLQTRNREAKSRHAQEIDELNSRLKFASLEQSLNSSGLGGEDDLIQSLIDKVSQLQEEVRRLRKGRDAQLITLQAENESLRVSVNNATPGRPRRGSDADGGRAVSFFESQIETLEVERDALRVRVTELVEALRASSSIEISEVEELRQRNSDLQRTVDKLTEIVNDQKRTLDMVNRHADEALRQNSSLRELTERLDLNLGDDHVLENILKRNIELESLLHDLQQQNNDERVRVSRRSTTATVTSIASDTHQTDPNKKLTTRLVHRQSASPLLTITTTGTSRKNTDDDDMLYMGSMKHASPATTPSTSVGESSRCSPPSPSLLGPQPDSLFVLSSSDNEHQKSDGVDGSYPIPVPRVSLYRAIRTSVEPDVDEMEEEGRGRCKRPRTSRHQGVTTSRYALRTRSKTGSLPATGSNSGQHVMDETRDENTSSK